jgi:hypothetical protein
MKGKPENEQWLVNRYSKDIGEGHMAAIWGAGQEGGIFAVGRVKITYPLVKALNPEQAKYYTEKEDIEKFSGKRSVSIEY